MNRVAGLSGENSASEVVPTPAAPAKPEYAGWASVIRWDPLIVVTWWSIGLRLGLLSVPGAFRDRAATVILLPSSSLQADYVAESLAHAYAEHTALFPRHRIMLAASNEEEAAVLADAGMHSAIVNANAFVSEHVFRPLPEIEPEYTAVYNARLHPQKRHELAAEINSLAFLFFRNHLTETPALFHANYARFFETYPNAAFINPITHDGCAYLPPHEVNKIYARSRVGLCLSAREGTMRVAIEYALAGLPVVSTHSQGGRDYFFDPEFCLVVDDDPRSVAEATRALADRNIPRDYIRRETLKKVQRAREQFAELIDSLTPEEYRDDSSLDRIQQLIRDNAMQPWRRLEPLLQEIDDRYPIRRDPASTPP